MNSEDIYDRYRRVDTLFPTHSPPTYLSSQYHWSDWDLYLITSGILEAIYDHPRTCTAMYYALGYNLTLTLTPTQKIILNLYLCSGFNQTKITEIMGFASCRSALSHIEAIEKKAHKLFTPSLTPEDKIVDVHTGRYENETVLQWFDRINGED